MQSNLTKFLNFDQQKAATKTSTRGCKWSSSTLKKSLQLHFACGHTGYNVLLSHNYSLPSLRTLRRSLENFRFNTGILSEVFTYLAIKVSAMSPQERECCMTLDEMSITAGVQYDNRNDNFLGGVTLPGHSGTDTHVLVFMLGGITTRWKQTIAYYYAGNSTDGRVFADIVIQIIRMCHEIGLNVTAVTSDMGSPNRAMWKKLGIVIGRGIAAKNSFPHPCNSENNVCILADVPHLIKNVRNHIVSGQDIVLPQHIVQRFQLPSATVSVAPLNRLVKFQEHRDLKPAPRLTSKHLDISHFDKMKVSQALHVFSHSVSSALRLMVATENWEENVLTTAWFLEIMNKWFELMTSRHPGMAFSKFNTDKFSSFVFTYCD